MKIKTSYRGECLGIQSLVIAIIFKLLIILCIYNTTIRNNFWGKYQKIRKMQIWYKFSNQKSSMILAITIQ